MQAPDETRRSVMRAMAACALAPLMIGASSAPTPSRRVPAFDAHCHIFNARDIPGEGFLRGPIANDFPAMSDLLDRFAHMIAGLVQAITPAARDELQHVAVLRSLDDRESIDERSKAQRQAFAEHFGRLAREDAEFWPLFASHMRSYNKQKTDIVPNKATPLPEKLDNERSILAILEEADGEGAAKERDDELQAFWNALGERGLKALTNPIDIVVFMYRATSPRYLNLHHLRQLYRDSIDVFCPSMIDFDGWLWPDRDKNGSTQRDNMLLLEQLAIKSGGTVLPLIAFNPAVEDPKGTVLALVREAVEQHGFIGVKIYPPMGFLPFGNEPHLPNTRCPTLANAHDIERALTNLYAWASKEQVPILTHTNHSMGPTSDKEECAGPAGWKAALDSINGLRVHAGHFAATKDDWAREFVAMMGKASGRYLYADLANIDDLFYDDSAIVKQVRKRLEDTLDPDTHVVDRVVYGSDFYMTEMSGSSRVFATKMRKFFSGIQNDIQDPKLVDKVFGLNAMELYGLKADPSAAHRNRDRLTSFYGKNQVPEPLWMRAPGA